MGSPYCLIVYIHMLLRPRKKIRYGAAFSWVKSLHVHVATKMNFLLIDITSCMYRQRDSKLTASWSSFDMTLYMYIYMYIPYILG